MSLSSLMTFSCLVLLFSPVIAVTLSPPHADSGIETSCLLQVRNPDTLGDVCKSVLIDDVELIPREEPVKVFITTRFINMHELPELKLLLQEAGDIVDEFHIGEPDMDDRRNTHDRVFEDARFDPDVAAYWKDKIRYHKVAVPDNLEGYDLQRWVITNISDNVQSPGVVIQADLDEIISRPALRALKHCTPADGSAWDAQVTMWDFKYSLPYSDGKWDLGPVLFEQAGKKASELQKTEEVIPLKKDRKIALSSGRPAGWHMSWMLDGAAGIAKKILIRYMDYPDWAIPYAHSEEALKTFIQETMLQDPSTIDDQVYRENLTKADLPESLFESPEKYRPILGDWDYDYDYDNPGRLGRRP